MEKTSFEKLAEDVSSKFADLIEAGKAPWSMGGSIPEYPVDAISGKPLAGITALQLLMKEKSAGFSDNRWLTEPQIAALGGKISKGARGIPSVVWTETTAGKQTQTKIPTTYYNVEQCENLSRLPPHSPYNHNPRDLMSDICIGFGIKPEQEFGNPSAYVNKKRELILGDSSVYDPSGKNYDKERLNSALDGIRAVTNFVNYQKHQDFAKQPEDANELALREKLARTFMQSYAGNRFPILDKDAEQAENKNLADFIRKHPASLFTSAADASRLVDRIMEISERSYILFDYERQDAFILKAGECRSYLAKEFSKLSLSGTLLNNGEVRELKDSLFKQGYFSPYSCNINILNPVAEKNLCSQLNHCGFQFVENRNRDNFLSPYDADILLAAQSRSATMAERAEMTPIKRVGWKQRSVIVSSPKMKMILSQPLTKPGMKLPIREGLPIKISFLSNTAGSLILMPIRSEKRLLKTLLEKRPIWLTLGWKKIITMVPPSEVPSEKHVGNFSTHKKTRLNMTTCSAE